MIELGAIQKTKSLKSMNPLETDHRLNFQYGRGSAYENETAITRTLDVLLPESELVCHDQRMFQVVHLNTELAWYNIHFELRHVIRLLDKDNFAEADRICSRVQLLLKVPLAGLDILIASMSQLSLLEFRAQLPANATGVDSPGMMNLKQITRVLWSSFENALERLGKTPATLAIHRLRATQLEAEYLWPTRVFDSIQQIDIKLMEWKQLHLRLVWTHLGGAVASMQTSGCPMSQKDSDDEVPEGAIPTSLRGKPISVLQKTTVTPLFPKLWQIPDLVYREMTQTEDVVY